MVAAAAEAVGAPDLHDVEADVEPVGQAVEEARDVARRRVILTAEAVGRRRQLRLPLRARAFRQNADMLVVAETVGRAAVADDVVVEDGDDVPALRLGEIGEDLAAQEPLLLARQRRIDDGAGEFVLAEHPRRLDHRRRARAVVIGAGRVRLEVHDVGDAAVDMALDDDDVVGPLGAALDGDHVTHPRRCRHALAGHRVARADSRQAEAFEPAFGPVERRADAAPGVGLRRQGVPRAEADQLGDGRLHLGAADRLHPLAQPGIIVGGLSEGGGCREQRGEQKQFSHGRCDEPERGGLASLQSKLAML